MKLSINFFKILPLILGFSITTQAQPTYLCHICPNATVFAINSTYHTNLNLTLSSLSLNANRTTGFYNTSAGQAPNHVSGLFLCRGDMTTEICRNCVKSAVPDITQRCPVEENAVVWYDQCLLRYSNRSIVSRMSDSPVVYLVNTQNISNQNVFNSLLATSMRDAADRAATGTPGGKKFAVKEANFTVFETLYNLVQCTPDLSSSDCRRCLEIAISQLPACCNGKRGGRVLTPSCNIRYEVYPFYNASVVEVPFSPPPRSPEILSSVLT
ncbi:cysteine-rich receptor-like protein kinase 25 [Euphorbia lathyris]|uniref:cysteine-rich receptor-like protein kinase 25 n=1 Tax=Euphorbia lathyris TaxID=212925 RepID=UPI003313B90D